MRIKPSNMEIYDAVELHFTATYIKPFNNGVFCCSLLFNVRWSKHGIFQHNGNGSPVIDRDFYTLCFHHTLSQMMLQILFHTVLLVDSGTSVSLA